LNGHLTLITEIALGVASGLLLYKHGKKVIAAIVLVLVFLVTLALLVGIPSVLAALLTVYISPVATLLLGLGTLLFLRYRARQKRGAKTQRTS
jgi:hypothetical protein